MRFPNQIICLFLALFLGHKLQAQQKITVGAKHFNEGYILSEIIAQLLENEGFTVERKFNLGGTAISFEALRTKAIDVYPEYSGTIASEVLKTGLYTSLDDIKEQLQQQYKLAISLPYGFNNTYAIVVSKELATKLQLENLSQLAKHPELKGGISYEFLKRGDGWKNLAESYKLGQEVKGIEHGLAYTALNHRRIDFTDAYSTDGEIKKYNLSLLKDDGHFFPAYQALSFYNPDLPVKAIQALNKLNNSISNKDMQAMNAMSLFGKKDFASIARDFLKAKRLSKTGKTSPSDSSKDLFLHLMQHIWLTFLSVFIAVCIALPLGIALYRYQLFLNPVLYFTGILQTIPSIALLALMIPLLGIGMVPAVTALCIYAILPVLRNTISGLKGVDRQLKEVAVAIGLSRNQRLRRVELPLAVPTIISGIRIATVINIGTSTLAAFIGAGGLGEYIVTGLALNNTQLILKGAIPAAVLAIAFEILFELIERFILPRHLKGIDK